MNCTMSYEERLRLAGIEHRRLRAAGYDVTLEDVIEAWSAGVDASDWHSPKVTS